MSAPARPAARGRAPRARRTQEERSAETRGRLLDATLALLVEVGHARTTTQAVAARAGLSRGAQLHHFPTKVELVVAAVRHLADKREAEVRAVARTSGREPALAALADAFDGPLFTAALELWVAARTDDALRAAVLPLERELGLALRDLASELLGTDDTDVVDLTLDLLRGVGVAVLLAEPAEAARRRARIRSAWAAHLAHLTSPTAATPTAPAPSAAHPSAPPLEAP